MQFDVTVSDQRVPPKTDTASVRISIKRDIKDPYFEGIPYITEVEETAGLNQLVIQLKGRDEDRQGPLVYGIDGYVPAPFYFGVDINSGRVFVKRNLKQSLDFTFTVCGENLFHAKIHFEYYFH